MSRKLVDLLVQQRDFLPKIGETFLQFLLDIRDVLLCFLQTLLHLRTFLHPVVVASFTSVINVVRLNRYGCQRAATMKRRWTHQGSTIVDSAMVHGSSLGFA